ncbi:MAG: cytochrome c oxidase subunit 3, partial [Pseudomonadales bacterium]
MSTQDAYESYYVPHNSKLPIFASLGIFLTLFGLGNILNDMTAGKEQSIGVWIFLTGGFVMGLTLFYWFAQV